MAVVTAALLISLLAVSGFAQFQTGNIYGKVQAKDGSVLPGVTVTLTGVGAPATTVTDAQGNYRFLNLSPGTYTLKAELAGYGTATRAGVGVRVGANSDVTLTLNPSVSESIVVTAEAPLLDVRKAGTAINVSKVELEKIPTSRDPWTILQQAPAVQVDRINVGGNQSGQQSVYIGKGTTADQNTWNVDGVNITDMGAVGSSPLYFDFDSFEEMQVTTGGSDPRIMTPGVQLNMVTKRGTNDFRGSGRYFYTPGSYQAEASVPGEATGYLLQTDKINFVRDYGGEIGGPLWRDHLWGWIADSENKISNQKSQNISGTTITGGAFDNIILRDKNAKLNAQILPSNSAVGFYTFGDKVRNARNLGPSRPFETSWRQTGPTKVYKLEDTQIVGSSLYLTGMWSKVSGGFSLIGNGGSATNTLRDISGVWHNNFESYITDRPQKQYRLDGSKFFDLGTMNHELKFGFGYRQTPVGSISTWPGGGWANYRSNSYCTNRGVAPGCYQAVIMRDKVVEYNQNFRDYYLGDTILMGNLTLQAGLRYDRQKSLNLGSSAAANPILSTPLTLPCAPSAASFCGSSGTFTASLPPLNFTGDPRELKWNSISPRLGLTYTLGADKKSLLRLGYNRYVDQVGPIVANVNPVNYAYAYALGVPTAGGDGGVHRSELVKWLGFGYYDPFNPGSVGASASRLDYGMKPQHTDELIGGLERELLTDFSVGFNLTYRKIHNVVGKRYEKTQGAGDFYTSNDFQIVPGVDPGGTYTNPAAGGFTVTIPSTPVYDLKPGIDAPTYSVFTNLPGYSRQYKGAELVATKRLSNRWMFRGNVSYNDWTEQCGEAYPNPTLGYGNCAGGQYTQRSAGSGSFGNVFISSRWSFNMTGLYQLPWDFNLGASLTGRQGYPEPFRINASSLNGDQQWDVNVLSEPIGSRRFPNVYELDLRAAKDFRFFNRLGLTLSADLFNVPNQRTVLQRQTALDNSGFGRITELQSPRVWRFGARLNF